MRIAMIGTRGVPARYGGFETAVEEIGSRLAADGHAITVYCRGERHGEDVYKGMRLVHLPAVTNKYAETLSHTALSVAHCTAHRPDVALVFNAANAAMLPMLKGQGIPAAVHVDGLEWRRSKWGPNGRRYYLMSERLAVRWADALIADAVGIKDYYLETYAAESVFIPYGAPILKDLGSDRLVEVGVEPGAYHLAVARFEPENRVLELVRGFAQSRAAWRLIVVGSAPYSEAYTASIERAAAADERVVLTGAIYDQELLNQLYAHSGSYIHGHTVGGTNPSLLRAMGVGAPTTASDVVFNREVLGETGLFWSSPAELAACIEAVEADPDAARLRGVEGQGRAQEHYDWDAVAADYAELCRSLLRGRRGRRARAAAG